MQMENLVDFHLNTIMSIIINALMKMHKTLITKNGAALMKITLQLWSGEIVHVG